MSSTMCGCQCSSDWFAVMTFRKRAYMPIHYWCHLVVTFGITRFEFAQLKLFVSWKSYFCRSSTLCLALKQWLYHRLFSKGRMQMIFDASNSLSGSKIKIELSDQNIKFYDFVSRILHRINANLFTFFSSYRCSVQVESYEEVWNACRE